MKYLITQEQVKDLIDFVEAFMGVSPVCEELAILHSLKPIEPLTEERIYAIEQDGAFWIEGTVVDFARAIEAAITGSTK